MRMLANLVLFLLIETAHLPSFETQSEAKSQKYVCHYVVITVCTSKADERSLPLVCSKSFAVPKHIFHYPVNLIFQKVELDPIYDMTVVAALLLCRYENYCPAFELHCTDTR